MSQETWKDPANEDLEESLRASLRRERAPVDFAAKVLAKTKVGSATAPKVRKPWLQRSFGLSLAATVAAMAIVPAVVLDYQRREQARGMHARGMKARQDLLTALAITKSQLQQAREKIQRTTRVIQ